MESQFSSILLLREREKEKKKKEMANLRTSTKCCKPKACQICAKGALLNLIDETVCSSRIIRLSSRPISPSPYRESRRKGTIRRRFFPPSYPIRGARFTERLRNVRERGRQLQAATNVRQFRSVARDTPRKRSTFREFQSARPAPEAFDENVRNGWP